MWSRAIVDDWLVTVQCPSEDSVISFLPLPLLLLCFWLCMSLWDKRIVLKGACSGIVFLSSSSHVFHFSFSGCCWVVVTYREMPAVSPRTRFEVLKVFPQVTAAFEHMLSDGQKVSASSFFFSMAGHVGHRRTLQGDNKRGNKKFTVGQLSWSFCRVDLMGNEILKSKPRVSLF